MVNRSKKTAPAKTKPKKPPEPQGKKAVAKARKIALEKKAEEERISRSYIRHFGDAVSPYSFVSVPPDLKGIHDQHVRVALDHLSKKATATKTKALEDLLEMSEKTPNFSELIDSSMLYAWTRFYPRLSVEEDRRIRQLAHTCQGQLFSQGGSLASDFTDQIIGPWLSGTFDSDKAVARAAKESLVAVYGSKMQISELWMKHQKDILDFCLEVLLNERMETLTDPVNLVPELAQAKYTRVMTSTLLLLCELLPNIKSEEEVEELDDIVGSELIWAFSSSSDPYLRRAVFRLLDACLQSQRDLVEQNLETISEQFISKAIIADQSASAAQYAQTLTALSKAFPEIWAEPFSAQAVSVQEFRHFLASAAPTASDDFWASIAEVFNALPATVLPQTFATARDSTKAIQQCITFARGSKLQAWRSYIVSTLKFRSCLADAAAGDQLIQEAFLPLVEAYFSAESSLTLWSARDGPEICASLIGATTSTGSETLLGAVTEQLQKVANELCSELKDSSEKPPSANSRVGRWFQLHAKLQQSKQTALRDLMTRLSRIVVEAALESLQSEDASTHSIAGAEALLLGVPLVLPQLEAEHKLVTSLKAYFSERLSEVILTYPLDAALRLLKLGEETPILQPATQAAVFGIIKGISASAGTAQSHEMLLRILPFVTRLPAEFDQARAELGQYIQSLIAAKLDGSSTSESWDVIVECLKIDGAVPANVVDEIFKAVATYLADPTQQAKGFTTFRALMEPESRLLVQLMSGNSAAPLLNALFSIATIAPAPTATEANSLLQLMMIKLKSELVPQTARLLYMQSLLESLKLWSTDTPRVEFIFESMKTLFWDLSSNVKKEAIDDLRAHVLLEDSLDSLLSAPPAASTASVNRLEGAVSLVTTATDPSSQLASLNLAEKPPVSFSPLIRLQILLLMLLQDDPTFINLQGPDGVNVLTRMFLILSLAEDHNDVSGSDTLIKGSSTASEEAILRFASASQAVLLEYLSHPEAQQVVQSSILKSLPDRSVGTSSSAFYHARVASRIFSEVAEKGLISPQQADAMLSEANARKTPDVFKSVAIITGLSNLLESSAVATKLQNELVSDLMGTIKTKFATDGLRRLVLLNALLKNIEKSAGHVPQRRVVLFVKHLLSVVEDEPEAFPEAVLTEVFKVIRFYLPLIDATYGEHWHSILGLVQEILRISSPNADSGKAVDFAATSATIPMLFEALKLLAELRNIKNANPDIQDAWRLLEDDLAESLISLLSSFRGLSDEHNLPVSLLFQAMSRVVSKLPLSTIKTANQLFPLMLARSRAAQSIAYELLHRYIPSIQEQLSYEIALSNETAKLPDELMAVTGTVPESGIDDEVDPAQLRGYLLSWILVFDHFRNATQKVKNDYIEELRATSTMSALLDFIFAQLILLANGRSIDASRLPPLNSYTPESEASESRDLQWLLLHAYFGAVRYVPSLSKSWWLNLKSRQIRTEVENVTEKFVTPMVVASEFEAVGKWQEQLKRDQDDDEGKFHVKVSPVTREVTAAYDVDEDAMRVVVKIPPTYPLNLASVEGVKRVALDEKKWNGFMKTAQGGIMFNNGSIVDGLNTWKRNVSGAMKGQTECAICYSIISGESYNKLPDKKCSTCRHLFHNSCLIKWFKSSGQTSCPLCRNEF